MCNTSDTDGDIDEVRNDASVNYETFSAEAKSGEHETVLLDTRAPVTTGQDFPDSKSESQQRFFPSFLLLCSSVLFTSSLATVRYLTTTFDASTLFIAFFRGVCQTVIAAAIILAVGNGASLSSLDFKSILLVSLRGLFGSIAIFMKFEALVRLPVGIAISLFATTPIFASLFGWLFLHERMSPTDQAALMITTIGSLLVGMSGSTATSSPESLSNTSHITGVILALVAALTTSSALVTVRAMGTRVHFLYSVFSLGIGCIVSPFVLALIHSETFGKCLSIFVDGFLYSELDAYLALVSVALFAVAGAMCLNRGAQLTPVGRVAMLRTFDIPAGFFIGIVLLGESPSSAEQLVGCALIALGTLLVAFKSST